MSKDESFFDLSAGEDVSDWGSNSAQRKPTPKPGTNAPQSRQATPKPPAAASPSRSTTSPSATGRALPLAKQPPQPTPTTRKTHPVQPVRQNAAPAPQSTPTVPPSVPTRPSTAATQQIPATPPAPSSRPSEGLPSSGLPVSPAQSPLRPLVTPPTAPTSPVSTPSAEEPQSYQSNPAYTPPPQIGQPASPAVDQQAYSANPPAPSPEWNFTPPPNVRHAAHSYDEEQVEDDDFIETPPPAKKSANKGRQGSRNTGKKGSKGSSQKLSSRADRPDMGGKTKANLIRWTALGLIGITCALGVKATFFPQQFPAPEQVVNVVQQGLGVSDFPADRAEAFVIAFTRAYLTVDNSGSSGRIAELEKYAPSGIVDLLKGSTGNVPQSISEGPYVSGIRYDLENDEDAVFTVASRLNNGYWVYLEIPVYYNATTSAFAVSGVPALVSEPALATVPEREAPWVIDEEANERVEGVLQAFFENWSSNTEAARKTLIDTYATNDANPRVINGIEGVTFSSIRNFVVSEPLEVNGNTESRIARVTVQWNVAPATVAPSPEDEFISGSEEIRPTQYDMTYEVMLVNYTSVEENSWRIRNIRGGVRDLNGGRGEVTEEINQEAG